MTRVYGQDANPWIKHTSWHWSMEIVVTECGSLPARIATGQADPISDREREQLEEMRQAFIKRFGYDPSNRV